MYIGQSKTIQRRWHDHLKCLRDGKHVNRHLQAAFQKYGEDAFEFSVIEECAPRNFVFTQNVASAKWEVQHDLDCWPAVTVVDSAGTEVVGDVQYIDKNKVVISFTAPFSGKAFFN